MTRHSLKIAALRSLLLLALMAIASVARAATYYIDYATGSNSNAGTSKGAPWKTHPYMQTGSSCTGTGSAPTYTHAAGDHFIFKGGVTWPAACFVMTIATGGASGAVDYYGVDTTWFSGGSFTQPKFDMANAVPTGNNVINVPSTFGGYVTFDDFEIANQGITIDGGGVNGAAFQFTSVGGSMPGVTIQYVNMHDWTSNTDVATLPATGPGSGWTYSSGCINDGHNRVVANHIICDDTNGYVFHSGVKTNGGWGGACGNCATAKNSVFKSGFAACFTVNSCHDNEMTGISQTIADLCPCRPHSQVVEDDFGAVSGMQVYNNYIHDNNPVGVTIYVNYSALVYGNVMKNNSNGNIMIGRPGNGYSSLSGTGYVLNNTVDGSNGQPCFQTDSKAASPGPLVRNNNICVTNGTEIRIVSAITTFTNGPNNYKMSTTEATTYGFVSANKYKPASSDANVSGKGANLTSSCSGGLSALCQDASGTFWFGGSPITRPSGSVAWDLGAYMGQGGGSSGPPSITISSPSPGTVSGSINLTASCTPQGSATVSSIQFTIDGTPFGAAGTSSPYTLSWNTATAANATHVIGATCTDSNAQVGTAATVSVTVSNSIPGCFISTDNDSGALSWTANQAFTAQTANFTATFTATPNTNNQNTVIALSQAPMSAYSQGAALIRFNSSGQMDVYKGSLGNYTADATVSYTAGTTYAFTFTVNMTAGTYSVALTSPASVTLATGYTFRTTASATSLGYINAISGNTTPDTAQVCNVQVGGSASLTFSPLSLDFGNVTVGGNSTQTITATTSGGSVNFSSVGISGNADFTINSNACSGSVPSSCTTQIRFAATSAALETATVTFTDDATGSPQSVAVSGTGVPATPTLSVNPASVNFGGVQVHTASSSGPIVLTISSGPVTFTGTPSFSGPNAADFALASNTCTGSVSAASCQTVVSFTPSLVAAESATLSYTDNATGSPQSVALTGTGYLAPHPPTAVHATVQ